MSELFKPKAVEASTRENTHAVQTTYGYDPRLGSRQGQAIGKFLQESARAAAEQGKRYIQVAYHNGTRVYRIYKTSVRKGVPYYMLDVPPGVMDEFKPEKS